MGADTLDLGNLVTTYGASADLADTAGAFAARPVAFVKGVSKTALQAAGPIHGDVVTVSNADGAGKSRPINALGPVSAFDVSFKRTDGLTGCTSITGTLTVRALDAPATACATSTIRPSSGWRRTATETRSLTVVVASPAVSGQADIC